MAAPKNFLDRLFFFLLLTGLCAIFFIAGSAVFFYRVPPSLSLRNAFEATRVWYETLTASPEEQIGPYSADPTHQADEMVITGGKSTWDESLAYEGYTLVSTAFSTSAWLVDMNGRIVHRWDVPFEKAFPNPTHIHTAVKAIIFADYSYVFPNGDLLIQYSALGDTPYGYGIVKVDKNSNVLWTYNGNAHHGFSLDKEGNIYTLTHNFIEEHEAGISGLPYPMLADFIVKLSPDGREMDKISIMDAFKGSPFELMLYHNKDDGLAKWDYFHTNSVEKLEADMAPAFPMFKAGQLLVSIRSISSVAVIDPDTRKVVWVYGGRWKQQHAAHFLPNGNLILIDNQGHFQHQRRWSRIIEFNPQTLGVTWAYIGSKEQPFTTSILGRLQQLPNGNLLVAESMNARILEITREGKIAWTYKLQRLPRKDPTLNAIVTSTRYSRQELPFLNP